MTTVYRCVDVTGRVLYVGCTSVLSRRLAQHRRRSWWALVHETQVVAEYENRRDAFAVEYALITAERPPFNNYGVGCRLRSASILAELMAAEGHSPTTLADQITALGRPVSRQMIGKLLRPRTRYGKDQCSHDLAVYIAAVLGCRVDLLFDLPVGRKPSAPRVSMPSVRKTHARSAQNGRLTGRPVGPGDAAGDARPVSQTGDAHDDHYPPCGRGGAVTR